MTIWGIRGKGYRSVGVEGYKGYMRYRDMSLGVVVGVSVGEGVGVGVCGCECWCEYGRYDDGR